MLDYQSGKACYQRAELLSPCRALHPLCSTAVWRTMHRSAYSAPRDMVDVVVKAYLRPFSSIVKCLTQDGSIEIVDKAHNCSVGG